MLNILVCATLFRPLKWELEDDEDEEDDEEDEEEDEEEEVGSNDEENSTQESDLGPKNPKLKNSFNLMSINEFESNKQQRYLHAAPVAKFDSNSAFTLSNNESLVVEANNNSEQNSNAYFLKLMEKDFSSDSCLPTTVNHEDHESTASLLNMNVDEEDMMNQQPKKQLLSYANSMISFSRCHSLEIKPEFTPDHLFKSKNQSVPVSLESACIFRSVQSIKSKKGKIKHNKPILIYQINKN